MSAPQWQQFKVTLTTITEEEAKKADRLFSELISLLNANGLRHVQLQNNSVSGHRNTAEHGRA